MIASVEVVQWFGALLVLGAVGDVVAYEVPTWIRKRRAAERAGAGEVKAAP